MSRRLAAMALLSVAAIGGGCSPVDRVEDYRQLGAAIDRAGASRTWQVVPVDPGDVHRLVVEGEGRQAEVLHPPGGVWAPGAGAGEATGTLMEDAQDRVLPMLSYRRLEVDASDPAFGLSAPEAFSVEVETHTAKRWSLRVGAPNPAGAGHYVQRAGDRHVYVVVNQVIDDLRSLLAGVPVERPLDPRVAQVFDAQNAQQDPEEVTNPWLGQVLETAGDGGSR